MSKNQSGHQRLRFGSAVRLDQATHSWRLPARFYFNVQMCIFAHPGLNGPAGFHRRRENGATYREAQLVLKRNPEVQWKEGILVAPNISGIFTQGIFPFTKLLNCFLLLFLAFETNGLMVA
jgi:hypothetical protein